MTSCVLVQVFGLLKCGLSTRAKYELYRTPRWFVKYAVDYFENNERYTKLFTLSTPELGIHQALTKSGQLKVREILNSFALYDTAECDNACVQLLKSNFPSIYVFPILKTWHSVVGKHVFETAFYKSVSCVWVEEASHSSVVHLVAMLFFLGQTKNRPFDLLFAIEKRLIQICDEPTFDEWVLVCHNFFVLKYDLSPIIMEKVLHATICSLPEINSYQLIAVLKALRHSRYPVHSLFPHLSAFIFKSYRNCSLPECAHFLATYANAGYYDAQVFGAIESQIFRTIFLEPSQKRSHMLQASVRHRSKDIARILWSMAHVGHCLAPKHFDLMLSTLHRMVEGGDFELYPHHLVDCLQSLIIFGHFPVDLLMHVQNDGFVRKCTNMMKAKPCHQLFFISFSTKVEGPEYNGHRLSKDLLSKLGRYLKRDSFKELSSRSGLQEMLTMLKTCYNIQNDEAKCISLLPHIPIAGIVLKMHGQNEKSFQPLLCNGKEVTDFNNIFENKFNLRDFVSVEVLNSSVCVGKNPNGLLATKIRQMKKLGCRVVTVSPETVSLLQQLTLKDMKEKLNNLLF